MQAQMMIGQALEHYSMMDFANMVLEQCWDICYDRQLVRAELTANELPDVKVQKMDACARKCVARHFEVMTLLSATRELREKERMQGLPPGTLTGQLTPRAQGREHGVCFDPLREAVTGNRSASWIPAGLCFILSDVPRPWKCVSQPDSDRSDEARKMLMQWDEEIRAIAAARAALPKKLLSYTDAGRVPFSFKKTSVGRFASPVGRRLVTYSPRRCITDVTESSGRGQLALAPAAPSTKPLSVHTKCTCSDSSLPLSLIDLCRESHQCGRMADETLSKRGCRLSSRVKLEKKKPVSWVARSTCGASRVQVFTACRTASPSATWRTQQSCPSAVAVRSISSLAADEGQRSASQKWGSSSPAVASASPRLPRVTRRLAAAWKSSFHEGFRAGNANSSACGGSSSTRSLATEGELRANFKRALRWRSDASVPGTGDAGLLAERDCRSMVEFVIDTFVSLNRQGNSSSGQGADLDPATCSAPVRSSLRSQLFVLLLLVDEACAALRGTCPRSTTDPRSGCEAEHVSVTCRCTLIVAAVQLCVLKHLCPVRGEADVWGLTAVVPYSAHVLNAAQRLASSVVSLLDERGGEAGASPESNAVSGVFSRDGWVGQQLCRLVETSWGSLSPSMGRGRDAELLSTPPLLLLHLLVESISWHGLCIIADVRGAQHLRHVSAAVLLIECVWDNVSEDAQVGLADQTRKALHLSSPGPCTRRARDNDIRRRTRGPSHLRDGAKDLECDARNSTALSPVTACFVSQVLDGCPLSISRLLLTSDGAHDASSSKRSRIPKPQDRESLAARHLVRLAPGISLSAAWRQRHSSAAEPMALVPPRQVSTAHESAASLDTEAMGSARPAALRSGNPSSSADCLSLQQGRQVRHICHRLSSLSGQCKSSASTSTTFVPVWCNVFRSEWVRALFLGLDPPAILRVAEAVLEALMLLPPRLSTVHEGPPKSHRRVCASWATGEDNGVCKGTGAGTGAPRCFSAVPVLWSMLASMPSRAMRESIAQTLLKRMCTALTESTREKKGNGDTSLTTERMRGASVCLAVLLGCPSTTLRDAASATHELLTSVAFVLNGQQQQQHSYRRDDDPYSLLCHWWQEAIGGVMLARHAQLARVALRCERLPPTEPSDSETPQCASQMTQSPASQFLEWWEHLRSLQVASHALPPHLRDTCRWAGIRGRRLCNTVAYLSTTSATTTNTLSPEELLLLQTPSVTDEATVRVACASTYYTFSLEHLCHLAVASSGVVDPSPVIASSSTASPRLPSVCALLSAEASTALLSNLRSVDGTTNIRTHALSAAQQKGDGTINVLQHAQGRPLTQQQHESLVGALHDFSRRRNTSKAIALFYAHERQHRRLRLSEVELFAETAKRAPVSFLVRLLLYVPPPCESSVLAKAIITGAWKAYQRALHQYNRRGTAAAQQGSYRVSSLEAQSRRRVEQTWYESVAVARRALSLLPRTGAANGDGEADLGWILSTLQRLLDARPRSLHINVAPLPAPSTSKGATVSAEEWNGAAVQSSQLLAALLVSPSGGVSVHETLHGAYVRQSIEEVRHIVSFCDANGDSTTAAHAYLRFSGFYASSAPHGRTVPLLPLNTCTALLRLAGTHMVTACNEDIAAHTNPTAAPPSSPPSPTPVPLGALVAYVEAHPDLPAGWMSETPCSNATSTVDASAHLSRSEGSEMEMLRRMRSAFEESGAAPPKERAESAVESSGAGTGSGRDAIPMKRNGYADAEGASVAAPGESATRRTRAYAVSCIATVERILPTLPAPLRNVLHADSALIPLAAILHDTLRRCQLRPRSISLCEGDANTLNDLDAASLHSLVDPLDGEDSAAADVVTQLTAAIFRLGTMTTDEAVDGERLGYTPSRAATAVADTPGNVTSRASVAVVTRRSFVCRAARSEFDFWRLVQHSDALLGYIWEYVWALYRLESTVLWVSPVQQQRAYLATAECAQVLVAALQTLDAWVTEMLSYEVLERGDGSDSDGVGHRVNAPACRTAVRDSLPEKSAGEQKFRYSVEDWRLRLRSGTLQSVYLRLFVETDVADGGGGHVGDTWPLLSSCLPSCGVEVTTSAAIAYMMTLIQHSYTAMESCSPANRLLQLAVDPVAAAWKSQGDSRLYRDLSSSQGRLEFLSATTQQYYKDVSRFVAASLPVKGVAVPLLTTNASCLSTDSLSYILHCMTATAVIVSRRDPHTLLPFTETDGGVVAALLARVAAVEGVLRQCASLIQGILVIEIAQDGAHAADGELSRTILLLSAALKHAALLLDECIACCALLDLEAAADTTPSSKLLKISDQYRNNLNTPMSAVNVSLVNESERAHIRAQLRSLKAMFVELYTSRWWGGVYPRLPEATRLRLWRHEEMRQQHLYISLVLRHHCRASTDAAGSLRLTKSAETLQQALTCHASSAAAALASGGTANNAQESSREGLLSLDALLNDTDVKDVAESAHCRSAVRLALERTLLALLTVRRSPDSAALGALEPTTRVSITDLEISFQRGVMACQSPRHATLLWRLFPALLDDGCYPSGAAQSGSRGGDGGFHVSLPPGSALHAEESPSATCLVPTGVWQQLVCLGDRLQYGEHHDPARPRRVRTGVQGMRRERLAVYAALLSRHPLVVMNVVRHPLVRHHYLAEGLRGRCVEVGCAIKSECKSGVVKEYQCVWLKELFLSGVEGGDSVTEATSSACGEAGKSDLPVSLMASSGALRFGSNDRLPLSSSPGPPALLLLPQPLLERFISALVLAVLRDASLMSDGLFCPVVATGPAGAAAECLQAPRKCSAPLSYQRAAVMSAQMREYTLLELVQHLGCVSPHAWRTAFRWITATPYPPTAHTLPTNAPNETASLAELGRGALSCADATTLCRLRAALLSCGPWPIDMARTLLEYAIHTQEAAMLKTEAARAHAGESERSIMPFPEAWEMYQQLPPHRPEKGRHNAVAPSHSLITPENEAAAMSRRANRFLLDFTHPIRPTTTTTTAAASSSCVADTGHIFAPGRNPPLFSIQLACQEGRRLIEAVRASTAPTAEAEATRVALRLCDLATAPSHTACAHLLTGGALIRELIVLPYSCVMDAVGLTWRTLLLRCAELDCCAQHTRSLTDVGAGRTAAEVRGRMRSVYLRGGVPPYQDDVTMLDVYAILFLLVARICAGVYAAPSSLLDAKESQRMSEREHRLSSLKQEVVAYWAAAWADDVIPIDWMRRCGSATGDAETICVRIDTYCGGVAQSGQTRIPRSGLVTLKEHLRRAQTRLQTASRRHPSFRSPTRALCTSSMVSDNAEVELVRVYEEVAALLRAAGAQMTSVPSSIIGQPLSAPEHVEVKAAAEPVWLLWPPAAWEACRLRASIGASTSRKAAVSFTLHNPVSVVRYLGMWQRDHAAARQRNRAASPRAGPQRGTGGFAHTDHERSSTTYVFLPEVCLRASHAVKPIRPPYISTEDGLPGSRDTGVSLMDVWCVADAFVRQGRFVVACLPRDDNVQEFGWHSTHGRQGTRAVMETSPLPDDGQSTAARTPPAGAGMVMQALLDLVSIEDARLQREQQSRGLQCTHSSVSSTPSDDTLVLLAVLRRLRQQLLPSRAGNGTTAAVDSASDIRTSCSSALDQDTNNSVLPLSPWSTYIPFSYASVRHTSPHHNSGAFRGDATKTSTLALAPTGGVWRSYLHVLHLCGDGLLNRAAVRSGRRASPSAATLMHVAHQVQRLVTLTRPGVWGSHSPGLSPLLPRLLSQHDAQRIICFQMRALQRIREHVNVLGWILEQQSEWQTAQQSVVATVAAVCSLERRHPHAKERPPEEKEGGSSERRVNRVEEWTAACFYPALVHLLRHIPLTRPSSAVAGASAQRGPAPLQPLPDGNFLEGPDGAETEVRTVFSSTVVLPPPRRHRPVAATSAPQQVATAATSESDRTAAALMAVVRGALYDTEDQQNGLREGCLDTEAVPNFVSTTPILRGGWRQLHALLSAVVAAVQRRSRDADPRLLLDFLSGNERSRLETLSRDAEGTYTDTLRKAMTLASSRPSSPKRLSRLVEAGLTLYILLHPWISFSAPSQESFSVEAALYLVSLALQQRKILNSETGTAPDAKWPPTCLLFFVDAVLEDILRRHQFMPLSRGSIAHLGFIYAELKQLSEEGNQAVYAARGSRRRRWRAATRVDTNVLLWRILNALSTLSEQDAAEVRDAWMAKNKADVDVPVTAAAGCGIPASSSLTDRSRWHTDTCGPHSGEDRDTRVVRALYRGSLLVIGEYGIGGDATEDESRRWRLPHVCAAIRLRTWLAYGEADVAHLLLPTVPRAESPPEAAVQASSASVIVAPPLRVLEEALLSILDGASEDVSAAPSGRRGWRLLVSGEKRATTWARDREWLACLGIYGVYAELKRVCTAPLWGWGYHSTERHARSMNQEVSPHLCDGARPVGNRVCTSDVASLFLQLSIAAALSAAVLPPSAAQRSSALSSAHHLVLLSDFVCCCDKLGTPLPSLTGPPPSLWLESQRQIPSAPAMVQVAPLGTRSTGCACVDIHAAVRHLATHLLQRLRDDRQPSTPPVTDRLQDWRVVVTPLQALQRLKAAFTPDKTSVREACDLEATRGTVGLLLTTSAGLQWTQICQARPLFRTASIGVETPGRDVNHGASYAARSTGQQLAGHYDSCDPNDKSLHEFYYAMLHLLCHAAQLTEVPVRILLKELLFPLADLERIVAETSTHHPTATEEDEERCVMHPTVGSGNDGAAVRHRSILGRLAVLTDVAKRVVVSPALRATTTTTTTTAAAAAAAGSARDTGENCQLTGWIAAWRVFKALAQIEDALNMQCGGLQEESRTGELAARTVGRDWGVASATFASRYADLLARGGAHTPEYLIFMLLVSRYSGGLLRMHEDAAASNTGPDKERRWRMRHAQLRHAIALSVPPAAVGTAMALFQITPLTPRLGSAATERRPCVPVAAGSGASLKESHSSTPRECVDGGTSLIHVTGPSLASLEPDEATLVQILCDLLQAPRGVD